MDSTSSTNTPISYNNNDNYRPTTTFSGRNGQLIERFTQSIKSDVNRRNALDYIHIYMRYWKLYEEKKKEGELKIEEEQDQSSLLSSLNGDGGGKGRLKRK